MGIQIDHNRRYTEDEKNYLKQRGRSYLIPANERRFGTEDEPRDPEEHEQEGSNAVSPFYNSEDREAAVYDVGGALLPNTTLDYNTGRAYDRENGVTVEYAGPGHTPGAYDLQTVREPEGFDSYAVDENGNPVDDDIDDDIVDYVTSIPNVTSLKTQLKELDTDYDSDDKRPDLENKLAIRIQDLRDAGEDPLVYENENEDEDEDQKQKA